MSYYVSREGLRTAAAVATLGGDFQYRDIMSPLSKGIPLFTNARPHPQVAVALLMPPAYWQRLLDAFTPRPTTLLAAIPAPSRIFLTHIDVPPLLDAMRGLVDSARGSEEELLSQHVYRFDGSGWRAVR